MTECRCRHDLCISTLHMHYSIQYTRPHFLFLCTSHSVSLAYTSISQHSEEQVKLSSVSFSIFGPGVLLVPAIVQAFINSLYAHCLWSTSEKIPRLKFCFPPYFGITRRNFKKKKMVIFLGGGTQLNYLVSHTFWNWLPHSPNLFLGKTIITHHRAFQGTNRCQEKSHWE